MCHLRHSHSYVQVMSQTSKKGFTRVRVQLRPLCEGNALASKKVEAQRDSWNRAVVAIRGATHRDKDVSQAVFAERLGVSRDVIVNIESDRRRVEVSDFDPDRSCARG
jgi:hypothetical protein